MKRQQGFTVIEVMIAIGVMLVGSMAIIGLQVQAQRQNQLSREYLIATQFAQTWVERLKIDALLWTEVAVPNGAPTVPQVLQNTAYLGDLIALGAASFHQLEPSVLSNHKQGATHQGYDIPGNNGLTFVDMFGASPGPSFCADARAAWVYFGRAMRADVRVYWPKPGSLGLLAEIPDCNDATEKLRPVTGPLVASYQVIYLPTVLRVTELRQ